MSELKYQILADAGLSDVSATVGTLTSALGYTLGEVREVNRVDYVLVNNAGNSQIPPGMVAALLTGSTTGYSVTVSTAVEVNDEIGAVVHNFATSVPTGAYFWGAKKGFLASGMVASAVCIPTGTNFYISVNGNLLAMPASVITGVNPIGVALTTVLSTTSGGGRNGSVYINLP